MTDAMMPNVLGSAVAGIISRIFTHPLDTIKAKLQATTSSQGPKYAGSIDVLRKTLPFEGIRGLYRGFGAVIIGGTPGTVVYLCSYEVAKQNITASSHSVDFIGHFAAGMLAETVACIIYVPVDVIKERMQVQGRSPEAYNSMWHAGKTILQTEGVYGIYRGYGATLGSFGPFSALYFMLFEKTKLLARRSLTGEWKGSTRQLQHVEIPFQWMLLCSSSAGAFASWITSPLDMAKLRLQIQRGKSTTAHSHNETKTYRGVVDCLSQAYRHGGLKELFRGAGARVIHFAPATAITMTCYETCRSFFEKRVM